MKIAIYTLTADGVTRQLFDAVDDCMELLQEEPASD